MLRVQEFGFKVSGLGCRIQGLGLEDYNKVPGYHLL